MIDVLDLLRTYEYSSRYFEEEHYGEATKEEIQQSMYEYLYFRDLTDYLEDMINKNKYTYEEMARRLKKYLDKKYDMFCRNSQKSIQSNKKATKLKLAAFDSVNGVLKDILNMEGYNV